MIALLLYWVSPLIAEIDDYQRAIDAYNRKDYKISYKLMLPLAEKGFAQAQYSLGLMYGKGRGVIKDNIKAIKWWELAAEQGDGKAQTNLGWMYEKGKGVQKDFQKAAKWYQLAADQGIAKAQEKLNLLLQDKIKNKPIKVHKELVDNSFHTNAKTFQDGLSAFNKEDYKTAHQLFLKLAEEGVATAQYNLGLMYGKGRGVVKDNIKAIKWWELAAEQGDGKAQTNLGWMYEKGKGVQKDFQKAAKWYQLASEQGITKAQEKLNTLLNKSNKNFQENISSLSDGPLDSLASSDSFRADAFDGARFSEEKLTGASGYINDSERFQAALNSLTKKEFSKAHQLFFDLADKGVAEAQINLGMMLEKGQGVPHDFEEAIRWYRLAAGQGLTKAQEKLNFLLEKESKERFESSSMDSEVSESINQANVIPNGDWDDLSVSDRFQGALGAFNKKEFGLAYQLFSDLGNKGVAEAQINLGMMLEKGQGTPKNFKEAIRWYRLAADQGLTKAQYNLGLMYAHGKGIDKDPIEATKWFHLAADQGLIKAQIVLALIYKQGDGVAQDFKETIKWYQLAAEQGDAEAQYNLGLMYANGQGTEKDTLKAIKWWKLAAEQGLVLGQYNIAVMYEKGDGVKQDFKEAVKWYQLAAEKGDGDSQYKLGLMYSNGEGILKDDKEAVKWFQLAFESGNILAKDELDKLSNKKSLWKRIIDIF